MKEFEQAHRRDDDIAIVLEFMIVLKKRMINGLFQMAQLSMVGLLLFLFLQQKTKDYLIVKTWNNELLQGVLKVLERDILIKEDALGGMVEFWRSLTLSFFFKFFL